MAWIHVQNVRPSSSKIPENGVLVRVSKAAGGKREKPALFIRFSIGAELARKAGFCDDKQPCKVMVGNGNDGKVAISAQSGGDFTAKRNANGTYRLTMNAAAADGRLNMDFPPFKTEARAINVGIGKPSHIEFRAGPGMLAAEVMGEAA